MRRCLRWSLLCKIILLSWLTLILISRLLSMRKSQHFELSIPILGLESGNPRIYCYAFEFAVSNPVPRPPPAGPGPSRRQPRRQPPNVALTSATLNRIRIMCLLSKLDFWIYWIPLNFLPRPMFLSSNQSSNIVLADWLCTIRAVTWLVFMNHMHPNLASGSIWISLNQYCQYDS